MATLRTDPQAFVPTAGKRLAKKILLATDRPFWQRALGSHQRISSLHQALAARGYEITVFFVGGIGEHEWECIRQQGIAITLPHTHCAPTAKRQRRAAGILWDKAALAICAALSRLRHLLRNNSTATEPNQIVATLSNTLSNFHCLETQAQFRQAVSTLQPDIVIVEYIRLAYLSEGLRDGNTRSPLLVIDTHDVMHVRAQRFADQGLPHWLAISREEETRVLAKFDLVLAIQSVEASLLRDMLPGSRIITVPFGVAIGPRMCSMRSDSTIRLGFLAAASEPNVSAMQWFIPSVFAPLRNRFGQRVELRIAGGICSQLAGSSIAQQDGITVVGAVREPADFWDSVDIAVNPVQFGAGLKIKNVEAISRGCALVTTSIGAEGMEGGIGTAFVLADSEEQMIASIAELVEDRDKRQELGEAAFLFCREHFAPDRSVEELCSVMQAAVPS
jgi:hypothetical protein